MTSKTKKKLDGFGGGFCQFGGASTRFRLIATLGPLCSRLLPNVIGQSLGARAFGLGTKTVCAT
jgi:hypothetical protein